MEILSDRINLLKQQLSVETSHLATPCTADTRTAVLENLGEVLTKTALHQQSG